MTSLCFPNVPHSSKIHATNCDFLEKESSLLSLTQVLIANLGLRLNNQLVAFCCLIIFYLLNFYFLTIRVVPIGLVLQLSIYFV